MKRPRTGSKSSFSGRFDVVCVWEGAREDVVNYETTGEMAAKCISDWS